MTAKVYGGVVPALEAEVALLREELTMERDRTEAARADVNALRCRNREAAGRIERLEAEITRLRTIEGNFRSERVRAEHLSALLAMSDGEMRRLREAIAHASQAPESVS